MMDILVMSTHCSTALMNIRSICITIIESLDSMCGDSADA